MITAKEAKEISTQIGKKPKNNDTSKLETIYKSIEKAASKGLISCLYPAIMTENMAIVLLKQGYNLVYEFFIGNYEYEKKKETSLTAEVLKEETRKICRTVISWNNEETP